MSLIWAVHTTMTAPQAPPKPHERVGSIGLEVSLMPILVEVSRRFIYNDEHFGITLTS